MPTNRILILGGGIAGIEAALALANMGYKVTLVEKSPAIGGKMAQLDKTFPTLDCSICIEGPLISDVARHPNIELLAPAELVDLTGSPGDFKARILVKPRYVTDDCTKCGQCEDVCPVVVPSEFEARIGARKAIYLPFPQAEPGIYVIDIDHCLNKPPNYFPCDRCLKACDRNAIIYTMMPKVVDRDVAAIIVSTGFDLEKGDILGEYGYGRHMDIVSSLEFERLVNASGPSGGTVVKPSTGEEPENILLVSCVGSRNNRYNDYCSGFCCTYLLKQGIYAKVLHGIKNVTIMYMNDVRTYGKGFESFYDRALKEGINIVWGRPEVLGEKNGKIVVKFEDTRGKKVTINEYDMVVLAPSAKPVGDMGKLSKILNISLNRVGFVRVDPANPTLTTRPGVFVAGSASGPRDISESVVTGLAAAIQSIRYAAPGVIEEEKYEETIEPYPIRVGVFVCHCGTNIAGVADVPALVEAAKQMPGVVHAEDLQFACAKSSLDRITQVIKEKKLNRVVVASCSPVTHLRFFQDSAKRAGLNPYLVEMTNIRNLDTWVHSDRKAATEKAKDMIRMAVAKTHHMVPLNTIKLPVIKRALVIGCGPAGLAAATGLAGAGIETILVEKVDECGGMLRRLNKLEPEGIEARKLLDRMVEEAREVGVKFMLGTTIKDVSGFTGNFHVVLSNGTELDVGAIVVATGAKPYIPTEFNYGKDSRVLTTLDLENGKNVDGKNVAIINCVGSRTSGRGCSKYCCAVGLSKALELREQGKNVVLIYRDIMGVDPEVEDLYKKARDSGVLFIRIPRKAELTEAIKMDSNKLIVKDVELGDDVEIPFDNVVLNIGLTPSEDTDETAKILRLSKDQEGFLMEAHPKLGPVDTMTPGIFIAGVARGPKNVGEAIAEGYAAAARALMMLAQGYVTKEPFIPKFDWSKCTKCGLCIKACPYNAIRGVPGKWIEHIPAACQGCGACVAECPQDAITLDALSDDAIMAQIEAALAENPEGKVVMFTCAYCSYWAADNAGIFKMQYPPYARIIRLQCSSRLGWKHVKRAFELGAAGVFVTGCRLGDCHYITANYNTVRRFENWKKRLKNIGIREDRFQMRLFGAPDVTDLVETMREAEKVVKTVTKEEIEQTKQKIKQLR